ncbi:MAG: hypothetical protein WCO60_14145 [Verrucomicrobiota bacterium]
MNRTTLLFLLPVAFLGFACERHTAESLPSHGSHEAGHASAPSDHAPAHAAAAKEGSKQDKPAPAAGGSLQFFDGTPTK